MLCGYKTINITSLKKNLWWVGGGGPGGLYIHLSFAPQHLIAINGWENLILQFGNGEVSTS